MAKRYAYEAWICSACDGHTIDIGGGRRCETCGYDYDYRGVFEPDPEFDEDYIAEHAPKLEVK